MRGDRRLRTHSAASPAQPPPVMARRPPAPKERPLSLAVSAPPVQARRPPEPPTSAPRVTQGDDVYVLALLVLIALGMVAATLAFVLM